MITTMYVHPFAQTREYLAEKATPSSITHPPITLPPIKKGKHKASHILAESKYPFSTLDMAAHTTSFEVSVAKEDFKFHAAHFVGS